MADTPYPPMRRKDRAMTDPAQLRRLLEQCQVMRLAMTGPQGPYVVPLNFGYALEPNGRLQLFFHCAAQGRKIRLLEADPRVCFEMDCQHQLLAGAIPCEYSYGYASIIGFGLAKELHTPEEREAGLSRIMDRFAKGPYAFDPGILSQTRVFMIEAEHWTGKRH